MRDLNFEFRVGKLSDADYQKTKLDLQRELAKVLAEIDAIQPALTTPVQPKPAQSSAKAVAATVQSKASTNGNLCKHCGAKFPQPMKFCGECGKAMAG
jgi:membrane protease subunit (stomatin/prohibitin family)